MPRLSWLLVFAIVFQLCLGGAWARPVAGAGAEAATVQVAGAVAGMEAVSGGSAAVAMPGMPAHCHEAVPVPQQAREQGQEQEQVPGHGADDGGCCSGAAHCHLCSAVGWPLLALALPALPRAPNIGHPAAALVSWSHPPELRPPI